MDLNSRAQLVAVWLMAVAAPVVSITSAIDVASDFSWIDATRVIFYGAITIWAWRTLFVRRRDRSRTTFGSLRR